MNDHPNPYDTINGYFDLPGDRTWGATGAIDISPDGETIWVAKRCGTNSCAGSNIDPVVNFDQEGNVLTTFGGGLFVWPHGFHVDREGNVWVSDGRGPTAQELIDHPETANMGHVVYKSVFEKVKSKIVGATNFYCPLTAMSITKSQLKRTNRFISLISMRS